MRNETRSDRRGPPAIERRAACYSATTAEPIWQVRQRLERKRQQLKVRLVALTIVGLSLSLAMALAVALLSTTR